MSLKNKQAIKNRLYGHKDFLSQFCISKQNGELHHAYLISGNIGIGKSLLSRQLAVYLLNDNNKKTLLDNSSILDEVEYVLSLDEDNSVWRQVFYHSHPDMTYLSASKSDQNKSGLIKIEDIKSIANITNHQSGRGGWRVIIIDSLDKTNRNGANAILKILEEPPYKTIFFLIAHNSSNVIPTIRSRCQQIKLNALSIEDTCLILKEQIRDLEDEQTKNLALLCEGSPGMALLIYESDIDKYMDELAKVIREKLELDEILKLAFNWGNNISKKPELSLATQFIFDKLFSESALRALNIKHNFSSNQQSYFSISKLADILAETFTSNELANIHMDWQKEFQFNQANYLDMGIFMQQTFYKLYSQMHFR